jgi:choline dehydrogenase-like flavoprotein
MATKLKSADIVIVGLGWTGGILAKELAETGLSIVVLERGAPRDTNPDFMYPSAHDGPANVRITEGTVRDVWSSICRRRGQVLAFFSRLPPCLVGLEACATTSIRSPLKRRSAAIGTVFGRLFPTTRSITW